MVRSALLDFPQPGPSDISLSSRPTFLTFEPILEIRRLKYGEKKLLVHSCLTSKLPSLGLSPGSQTAELGTMDGAMPSSRNRREWPFPLNAEL